MKQVVRAKREQPVSSIALPYPRQQDPKLVKNPGKQCVVQKLKANAVLDQAIYGKQIFPYSPS
jgi:hypothetical protein